MPIVQTPLDYSDRDFESLRLRLQGLIRSVYPTWTDFNVANFGNVLLELFAHVGDTLHFYQDNQAGEAFWPSLTQRISAIRLGRLISFSLTGATSATGTARFSIAAIATEAVVIPVGTSIQTTDPENPQLFRTTVATTIPIGSLYVDVAIEQAVTRAEQFTSNEEPRQELILTHSPYLDSSLTITAGDGAYTEADSFLGKTTTDKVFIVLVDQFDKAHIKFGNGAQGAIPQGTIVCAYKTGGGVDGNVETGSITILNGSLKYTPSNTTAAVSITNPTATSGGTDRMTLQEARQQAPASLRVLTRTVTREDFETVAEGVTGVARALMVTANEDAAVSENYGVLYVVAQGATLDSGRIAAATPSTAILANVVTAIDADKPPTITFQYETRVVSFKTVNVNTRVYIEKGYTASAVGDDIRDALADFFAAQLEAGVKNSDIDFGANLSAESVDGTAELAWSDILNAIRDVAGVRKVDEGTFGLLLNNLRQSISLSPVQFPQLGTVVINDVDSGSVI